MRGEGRGAAPSSAFTLPPPSLMKSKLAAAPETQVAPERGPGPFGRVFRAFAYRDFRLLWFGAFT